MMRVKEEVGYLSHIHATAREMRDQAKSPMLILTDNPYNQG